MLNAPQVTIHDDLGAKWPEEAEIAVTVGAGGVTICQRVEDVLPA